MAFLTKTDYFSLAGTTLVCISNSDGATASVAEATDAEGTIVAHTVYGATSAPSNSYVVKGTVSSTTTPVTLGKVTTAGGKSFVLGSFSINTSAGSPATVEASGEEVEASATTNCSYTLPTYSLPVTHHAHILFDAFSIAGTGCHLQSANYSATVTITKATKEGACLAHDVSEGKIEAQITVNQTGSTEPTLTAGTGWTVTAPLACDNPDADYPTWSATLTHYLAKDTPTT